MRLAAFHLNEVSGLISTSRCFFDAKRSTFPVLGDGWLKQEVWCVRTWEEPMGRVSLNLGGCTRPRGILSINQLITLEVQFDSMLTG